MAICFFLGHSCHFGQPGQSGYFCHIGFFAISVSLVILSIVAFFANLVILV